MTSVLRFWGHGIGIFARDTQLGVTGVQSDLKICDVRVSSLYTEQGH